MPPFSAPVLYFKGKFCLAQRPALYFKGKMPPFSAPPLYFKGKRGDKGKFSQGAHVLFRVVPYLSPAAIAVPPLGAYATFRGEPIAKHIKYCSPYGPRTPNISPTT